MPQDKDKDVVEDVEVVTPDLDVLDSEPRPADQKLVLARDVLPSQLPIIPITDRPLFPKMTVPMIIDDPPLVEMLIAVAESESRFVGIVLLRPKENEPDSHEQPKTSDLYRIGVVAEIFRMAQLESQPELHVMLTVLERFSIEGFVQETPHIVAKVSYMFEPEMTDNEELKAYSVSVIKCIKELVQLNPLYKEELSIFMSHSNLQDPGRLADFAAALTTSSGQELQEVLRTVRIRERLSKVLILLKREIEISELQVQISSDIEKKISNNQREFFLREQLKAIKKELGIEKGGKETEVERFEERISKLTLPEEAKQRIDEELSKLKMTEPSSPEYNVTRGYLDWLTVLPWGIFSEDNYDIVRAEKILNEDHYGLEDVKERILEFLAVGILKGNVSGSILCFVGPPASAKHPSDVPSHAVLTAISTVSHSEACGMKPKSRAIVAPTSAPCLESSFSPSRRARPPIRLSCLMKSTK